MKTETEQNDLFIKDVIDNKLTVYRLSNNQKALLEVSVESYEFVPWVDTEGSCNCDDCKSGCYDVVWNNGESNVYGTNTPLYAHYKNKSDALARQKGILSNKVSSAEASLRELKRSVAAINDEISQLAS